MATVPTHGTKRRSGNGRKHKSKRIKRENKFIDTAINFTFDLTGEIPATGGQLCIIPQGSGESERRGREVLINSVQINATLVFSSTGNNDAATTYLFLILDKQANGAVATTLDVFTSENLGRGLVSLENSKRFTILKRWAHDWYPQATSTSDIARHVTWQRPLNIPITYDNTADTGDLSTIRSNNIFLMAGASGSLIDDKVRLVGLLRLRYTD